VIGAPGGKSVEEEVEEIAAAMASQSPAVVCDEGARKQT